MTISRRHLFMAAGARRRPPLSANPASAAPATRGYRPVRTLNGWTLPYRMENGVKEFHLVAEEFEHEFAPGCTAKVWGYNGTHAGPDHRGGRRRSRAHARDEPAAANTTTMHWHGIILPSGMDGVGGLTQPHIKPGETFAYEFTLQPARHAHVPPARRRDDADGARHDGHVHHPSARRRSRAAWTATTASCCTTGRCIRARTGPTRRSCRTSTCGPSTARCSPRSSRWSRAPANACASASAICRCGTTRSTCTASSTSSPGRTAAAGRAASGGARSRRSSASARRATSSSSRVPGDWALHCHMAHHTMNAMGHDIPNNIGVDQSGSRGEDPRAAARLHGDGRERHGRAPGPRGIGPHEGPAEHAADDERARARSGTSRWAACSRVVKVRDDLARGDFRDPGWYRNPPGTVAQRISTDPDFGAPIRAP